MTQPHSQRRITREIKRYLRIIIKTQQTTPYRTQQHSRLRGKLTAVNAYIKKGGIYQINRLT